jgi:hypothetical protein
MNIYHYLPISISCTINISLDSLDVYLALASINMMLAYSGAPIGNQGKEREDTMRKTKD